jgi:hypothetical protein
MHRLGAQTCPLYARLKTIPLSAIRWIFGVGIEYGG